MIQSESELFPLSHHGRSIQSILESSGDRRELAAALYGEGIEAKEVSEKGVGIFELKKNLFFYF